MKSASIWDIRIYTIPDGGYCSEESLSAAARS